ncbi:hypothetical protein ACTHS7_12270, partial [Neisseria sp. P0015.S009]|uniref:hypothetical protein n=1 Tax=Neisseria sp. P0015.S009 TaxID=3436765 RepID=UPI003F7DC5A2
LVSTHSRPKAAGDRRDYGDYKKWFKHTAARRRLVTSDFFKSTGIKGSTHSRPKAAGCPPAVRPPRTQCFNTQPPEGGWRGRVNQY